MYDGVLKKSGRGPNLRSRGAEITTNFRRVRMGTANEKDNKSTIGGPANATGSRAHDFTRKLSATDELAAAIPHNANKAGEHGEASTSPDEGQALTPYDPFVTGSR